MGVLLIMVWARCVQLALLLIAMVAGQGYYGDFGDYGEPRGRTLRRRVVTRVTYKEPRDVKVVYRRRKTRPVTVISSRQPGSYVGLTGRRGSVGVVNTRPVTSRRRVVVVG